LNKTSLSLSVGESSPPLVIIFFSSMRPGCCCFSVFQLLDKSNAFVYLFRLLFAADKECSPTHFNRIKFPFLLVNEPPGAAPLLSPLWSGRHFPFFFFCKTERWERSILFTRLTGLLLPYGLWHPASFLSRHRLPFPPWADLLSDPAGVGFPRRNLKYCLFFSRPSGTYVPNYIAFPLLI